MLNPVSHGDWPLMQDCAQTDPIDSDIVRRDTKAHTDHQTSLSCDLSCHKHALPYRGYPTCGIPSGSEDA